METAIVTGAAGFIGSHLSERLLKEGFRVIGIDCFTDYYSKEIKKKNLEACLKNESFTFVEEDLMNADLATIFKKGKFLFHEAAQPGVRSSWGREFDTYVKNNIQVTQRILEEAKNANFTKIVLASSSSVYGNQLGKMNENLLLKPESPYGITKLASENLGSVYSRNYNLPIISLRYFTVYGPRQRPDMAFFRFIKSILTKKEITIYGDGNQTRDFTYVSDIVEANMKSVQNHSSGEIINVGGGHVVSIKKVLETLSEITGIDSQITYMDKQKGDVMHTEADISKANKIINYDPQIKLKEGLKMQIEYTRLQLELYK